MNVNSQLEDIQNESLYNEVQNHQSDIEKFTTDKTVSAFLSVLDRIFINRTHMGIVTFESYTYAFYTCVLSEYWNGYIGLTRSPGPGTELSSNTPVKIIMYIVLNRDIDKSNKWIPIIRSCYLKTTYGYYTNENEKYLFRLGANGFEVKIKEDAKKGEGFSNEILNFNVPIENNIYARTTPIGAIHVIESNELTDIDTTFLTLPAVYSKNIIQVSDELVIRFMTSQQIPANVWLPIFGKQSITCANVYTSNTTNYELQASPNGVFVKFKEIIPKYTLVDIKMSPNMCWVVYDINFFMISFIANFTN